jgi:hypothetical protein
MRKEPEDLSEILHMDALAFGSPVETSDGEGFGTG